MLYPDEMPLLGVGVLLLLYLPAVVVAFGMLALATGRVEGRPGKVGWSALAVVAGVLTTIGITLTDYAPDLIESASQGDWDRFAALLDGFVFVAGIVSPLMSHEPYVVLPAVVMLWTPMIAMSAYFIGARRANRWILLVLGPCLSVFGGLAYIALFAADVIWSIYTAPEQWP